MIEIKMVKQGEAEVSVRGTALSIAAETCAIIEHLMKVIEKRDNRDGQRYLQMVKTGIDFIELKLGGN